MAKAKFDLSTLSLMRRFGQGMSYSPYCLVIQSAGL